MYRPAISNFKTRHGFFTNDSVILARKLAGKDKYISETTNNYENLKNELLEWKNKNGKLSDQMEALRKKVNYQESVMTNLTLKTKDQHQYIQYLEKRCLILES